MVKVGKQLAVVTKLFYGEDPGLSLSLEKGDNEVPVAHSVGPEARITGKSTIPNMHISPAPKARYTSKAPAPGRIPVVAKLKDEDESEDDAAAALALKPGVTRDEIVEFILGSSYVKGMKKGNQVANRICGGCHYLFGAFRHGGVVGLTNNIRLRAGMAMLLSQLAKQALPDATFTTVALSVNAQTLPHKDSTKSPSSVSHWIPVSLPKAGGRRCCQRSSNNHAS